jgi:hypothetical protein
MTDHTDAYDYRRSLRGGELLPAVGIAVGVGALAFYIARVLLERTPMSESLGEQRPPRPRRPAAAQRRDGAA